MNANKQDAGGEVTNPDNVGGLVWYVCTSCMLMVQLPSDTPTLGRCQCSPKGWSLRRAKLPKGYELCRAAPAGGDRPETMSPPEFDGSHVGIEDRPDMWPDWVHRVVENAINEFGVMRDNERQPQGTTSGGSPDYSRITPPVSANAVGEGPCQKCHGTLEVLTNHAEPWSASAYSPCPDCHPAAKKDSAPAGSGEVQWPPRAMRGDDYVMLDDGRETLPLMSGCKGCRADEAGTWNRCIDECQKAVAKASGAGPDAFRLARWLEIHFRGEFPTPEFRDIHAALLRKLQQGADKRLLDALKRADALAVCCTAVDSYSRNELWDIAEAFRAHIRPLIASQGQEGGENG